jgi:hypothetical protein
MFYGQLKVENFFLSNKEGDTYRSYFTADQIPKRLEAFPRWPAATASR